MVRKAALIIMDEASMMEWTLFKLVNVVLNHLLCQLKRSLRRRFGDVCLIFFGDYPQLLQLLPSRKIIEAEHQNHQHENIRFLDQLSWASSIWEHVIVLRLKIQVRTGLHPAFRSIHHIEILTDSSSTPLPLKSRAR